MTPLRPPFPYFGNKRRAADLVWQRFGDPKHVIDPFAGSLAIHLLRKTEPKVETFNDKDPYLANLWRALQADPEAVAHHADWPVNEVDLHARHAWLVQQEDFRDRLFADPTYYDAKIAGWWVWGLSMWIGGEFCGERFWTGPALPWTTRPHLSDLGKGVHVTPRLPKISSAGGCGVTAVGLGKRPALAGGTKGVQTVKLEISDWMKALASRLRRSRMCCGDWRRVVTPAVLNGTGTTAVFLDPPYSAASGRARRKLYGIDSFKLAEDVAEWAREHGEVKGLRIALCGFGGEHRMPGWTEVRWKRPPGYGNTGVGGVGAENPRREVIWFSPHCLEPELSEVEPVTDPQLCLFVTPQQACGEPAHAASASERGRRSC